MKSPLTIKNLQKEVSEFASRESRYDEPSLYGITDGKAIGTYLENKLNRYLANTY